MPTCSSCGGNFDDTFQFCPYCGKPKPKPQEPIKVDVVSHEPPSPLDCPKCHRIDNVSKVSAIVQGGTHEINGQIPVSYTSHDSEGWHSGTSYESYHATQQSTLAKRLMPPEKPTKEYSGFAGCLVLPFLISLLLSPTVCASANLFLDPSIDVLEKSTICLGQITYVAFLFGLWRLWVFIDKPFKARHAVNMAAWEYSLSKWRELYYCSRDDCVFTPSGGVVTNLNEAIKWSPVKKSNPFFPKLF